MTFDDDFLVLRGARAPIRLRDVGLEWPPPERIVGYTVAQTVEELQVTDGVAHTQLRMCEAPEGAPDDTVWLRRGFSQLTDEERAGMTHVARGAEYVPAALA